MKTNIWLNGMMGLNVGDALGVPVQFMDRTEIRNRAQGPVTGMEAGGVYQMPEGTWSDDSSMALATLESLLEKKAKGITDYTAEAAFLQGAAAAQEGAYRDLVGSLNISVEEMKRMLRDCLPR